jgi:MFS family permease
MEWHVIGMFAPAFVTGWLIARIGVLNVLLAGAALMVACVAFAVTGVTVFNFWLAVVLVGVGWNLLFVGGTTLLTECCTPAEQAKTQGLNDVIIFTGMAISTFGSGGMLQAFGWNAVNWGALPLVALTAAATVWLALRREAPQKALSGSFR